MGAADRARARLVDGLRDAGVLSGGAVEEAFRAVPRHRFLPGVSLARAYADEAVPVQTVDGVTTSSASQPSMMAIMLGQLDLRPGHRVLEVGAGTGYNAALMARIVGPAGRVVAVDIDRGLVDGAARHLADAGVTGIELVCGDGALGHPAGAPYDRIVLTVGSDDVRPEWIDQLAPGGRLLLPLALGGTQLSIALDLGADGILRSGSVCRCGFVRLRGVGATPRSEAVLDGRITVLPAGGGTVRAELVEEALAAPGTARPVPVSLDVGDLWNGFGLWLALAEPGTFRLLAGPGDPDDPRPTEVAADPFPMGAGRAALGLLAQRSDAPGLAVVVLVPEPDATSRGPRAVQVRGFGPAGPEAVDRLLAACAAWREAGRPTAASLRFAVEPRGGPAAGAGRPDAGTRTAPPTGETPSPTGDVVRVGVVEKEHCRVVVSALRAERP